MWLFGVAISMVLAFGSCKPKQSAYKAAYEQAKEKETVQPEVEEEEEEIVVVSKPRTSNASVRQEKLTTVQGEDPNGLKRYSVVIGSFKNKTNATALKARMADEGYNPILAQNELGMLRVIVSSFDNKADAADSRDALKDRFAPNFADAWLLERQY